MAAAGPGGRSEGRLRVHSYNLYWRSVGDGGTRGTVLMLHGGPGMCHDYLLPFEDLASAGYRVLFYDQLGCGRSERAQDPGEYSIDRDVEDLEELRRTLDLGPVHLIGSSYGGLLAIAYALAHAEGMRSLVSVSGLADVPLAVREMARLVRALPAPAARAIADGEARGQYDSPAYCAAVGEFYRRHLCRLDPWPAEVTYTLEHVSVPKYGRMNGPNEFTIVGTIRDWTVTDRLGEIRVPTLVTVGKYDEVTPVVAGSIHRGIPGSELRLFSESSHLAFWEERSRYFDVLRDFLDRQGPSGRSR